MRKFYLENSHGERLSLSEAGSLWLNTPTGLGMNRASSYEEVKPGFFVETSEGEGQGAVSGSLVFRKPDTYKYFQEVTDWIMRSDGLKIVYCPFGTAEYYRDIDVLSIAKGEKKLHSWLECPVTLTTKTPWYSMYTLRFSFDLGEDESFKRYPYRYPYRYAAAFAPRSLDFEIGGHYPGEIELLISGPLSAPVLRLAHTHTNEVIGILDLSSVVVLAGETLRYSTRTVDPGVWIVSGGESVDIIDRLELQAGVESFFQVPPHTPVTATLAVEGTIDVLATMNVAQYYKLR